MTISTGPTTDAKGNTPGTVATSPVPLGLLDEPKRREFFAALAKIVPADRVIQDLARRVALSTDASFYHLTPYLVVQIKARQEIQSLLALSNRFQVALTFRAAGTSLSGQAISNSILVTLTPDWQQIDISEQGRIIRLQPGVIGAKANHALASFGRKIGPDPASINTCKIGGIAANNASGMCCGVKNNSYHTLKAMQLVLADGSYVDTGSPASVNSFRHSHKDFLNDLAALSAFVKADKALVERINYQYRLKNTVGYGINALVDFTDPLDILCHLMIGSEGTLGFIAGISYATVPVPRFRAAGLYLFASHSDACQFILAVQGCAVEAVELMDSRALRAVEARQSLFTLQELSDGAVALLIELGGDEDTELNDRIHQVGQILHQQQTAVNALCEFSKDPVTIAGLWQIRKGLFPAVGAVRETGTTVVIEDVAFPLTVLADALGALRQLFVKHQYHEAIIFGHALDGNLHFVFTQRFDTAAAISRYNDFMQDVVALVTGQYGGTLKAEHGTGRNMAPFLHAQWGDDGVSVMQRVKSLIDPNGILNPGVILNSDPSAHLKDLKQLPAVDPSVDKCIECGFCEPQCPSLNYTLSPRQRIALKRRQQLLETSEQRQIDAAFSHLGIDSCAATGLCATTCPVGINTGEWIVSLREQQQRHPKLAAGALRHFPLVTSLARHALGATRSLSRVIPSRILSRVSAKANRYTHGQIPVWYESVPRGAKVEYSTSEHFSDKVIYLVSCPNRIFASTKGTPSLADTVISLLNKAGFEVIIPGDNADLCCGQPWSTKGYADLAARQHDKLTQRIVELSEHGRFPVITDASACALQMRASDILQVHELSAFLLERAVPRLKVTPLSEPVMLHTTCSSVHMDSGNALKQLARICCDSVIEPEGITCCGFAGDKGLYQPGLNAAALAPLAGQVPTACSRGVSNSRTCEIGLSHHSGIIYQHIAYLLDDVSQPLS